MSPQSAQSCLIVCRCNRSALGYPIGTAGSDLRMVSFRHVMCSLRKFRPPGKKIIREIPISGQLKKCMSMHLSELHERKARWTWVLASITGYRLRLSLSGSQTRFRGGTTGTRGDQPRPRRIANSTSPQRRAARRRHDERPTSQAPGPDEGESFRRATPERSLLTGTRPNARSSRQRTTPRASERATRSSDRSCAALRWPPTTPRGPFPSATS